MKVLWLVNSAIPCVTQELGGELQVKEGWITGMLNAIMQHNDIELHLVFPYENAENIVMVPSGRVTFWGYVRRGNPIRYGKELFQQFLSIVQKVTPDIIHIMGSEYPHTYSMCEAAEAVGLMDKTVISIQGLISEYAKVYFQGMPWYLPLLTTPRDILKGNLIAEQRKFYKRGQFEIKALQKVNHVIGRTEWDKACCSQINPKAIYHHNNENLRDSFYASAGWEYSKCQRNTIFMSQADYAIKGLHIVIQALPYIKALYPDFQLRIAGGNILAKESWKLNGYAIYILDYIKKHNLTENIIFLGKLDEKAMREEYLKANAFLCASLIENSPNSVGEAMLLGTPTICADVGGVKDFIVHGKNAFLFPVSEPNMIAYYVAQCFDNESGFIEALSECARQDISQLYDRKNNAKVLYDIYYQIIENGK